MARFTRRRAGAIGAALAGAGLGSGCAGELPFVGTVVLPERSLTYAPLILAVKNGVYPPGRLALSQRVSGPAALAAVADGSAVVTAVSGTDFLAAVAGGAPLVAVGALTRRFGGYLVVSPQATAASEAAAALVDGRWRALRLGVETGSGGTEAAARLALLAVPGVSPALAGTGPFGAQDPQRGEPRWIPYSTGEGLVAAINDGRIAAFLGRSLAAAQATLMGDYAVATTYAAAFPRAAGALCTVLVARGRTPLVDQIVAGCARAAAELSGPDGDAAARQALADRDALHLAVARQLDAPSLADTVYATDGRLPADALPSLLDLLAGAGWRYRLDARRLVAG